MSSEELSESDVLAELGEYVAEVEGEPRLEVDTDGRRHTVEIRPIYNFERDILDDLIGPNQGNISGAAIPIKGRWIHGWLDLQGEDYINNIWKNYQYFLKYIQARTSKISNIGTYNRSPGTYDSMYRYLLILEELELLERYRREDVGADEYDFPVPAEFRERTFIRLSDSYEGNEGIWNNPYEALYGEPEPDEGVEIGIDTGEIDTDITEDDTDDTTSIEGEGLGAFTGDDDSSDDEQEIEEVDAGNLPESDANIEQFQNKGGILELVEQSFPEALQRTFEEAPIPGQEIDPEQLAVGRVAIYGPWATGKAKPGVTELDLVVSVDDSNASISPGYVPAGIQEHLGDVMAENNPYSDIFPSYFTVSSYNSAFSRIVSEVVRGEQSELIYYNLNEMEFEEL